MSPRERLKLNFDTNPELANLIFNKLDVKGAARTELYNDNPNLTTVLNVMAT